MREILLILFLITCWIFFIEPQLLQTTIYNVEMEQLAGKKAILAGDFHFTSKKRVKQVVKKINEQQADYIFYIGDYTEKIPPNYVIDELSKVNAPVYSVLGNHDSAKDFAKLPNLLNNRNISTDGVTIAGITYFNPDISKALENAKGPIILLSHNPDVYPNKVPERVKLILSGHTHGGQITLFGKPFITTSKYRYGKGFINNRLIITGGTGTIIIPARLFNPPEITVIKFTSK